MYANVFASKAAKPSASPPFVLNYPNLNQHKSMDGELKKFLIIGFMRLYEN